MENVFGIHGGWIRHAGRHRGVPGHGWKPSACEGIWRVVGQADRRPGLTARAARAQAVQDATEGKANRDDVYAAVPLSEWRIAVEL